MSSSKRANNIDDLTYNPQADAGADNAAFNPDSYDHPVGARGADNQPTSRDFEVEDRETTRSEQTGQIPRGEVKDLLQGATDTEKNASGRTRGVKVDAWKQDRELDQSFQDTGLANATQDVEIGKAVGNK